MATLTSDAQRERLLRLLAAGDTYPFLTDADRHLEVHKDDHFVRLMAVREFLKLGLPIPARELLEAAESLFEVPEEFSTLHESLKGVRGGLVPWSHGQKQFEANLASLEQRGVETEALRLKWREDAATYQWHRDANQVDQIRVSDDQRRWRWMPALAHHPALADAHPLPEETKSLMPGPYLFEGIDLGWFFERIYRATHNTFLGFSCALFVVETHPSRLAALLHLRDWRKLLADRRVFWFLGPDAPESLRQAWEGDFDLPWPRQAFSSVTSRSCSTANVIEVVRAAGTKRELEVRDSLADLNRRYAHCDLRHWARRFDEALNGRGAPLRLLSAVSTHTTFLQYSMRDAKRAVESLGHACTVLTERQAYGVIGPLTYHHAIRELHPDAFFALDHLRPEFDHLIPQNLPILTWDQDQLPHVFTRENMRSVARHDFLTGCSKSKWVLTGCDPQQFLHARLPTCPEQFDGPPPTAEEELRYGCDVSYISHASQTARAFHDEQRTVHGDAGVTALLDALYELLPEALKTHRVASGPLADWLLETVAKQRGIVVRDSDLIGWIRGWYLWRLGDRLFRHEALDWIGQWARRKGREFRIYGNGWDRHPTLAPFAAGPAEQGRELVCIHRLSKINVQLMPAGFIHQRALDGLAAGGFFLTRKVPLDLRGRVLRRLQGKVHELHVESSDALRNHLDPELQALLGDYFGTWLHRIDRTGNDLLGEIGISAELEYPDEAFPGFEDLVFDSAEEFAVVADRFLRDDGARRLRACQMREVVIERFSYRSTLARFLRGMAKYLAGATEKPSGPQSAG